MADRLGEFDQADCQLSYTPDVIDDEEQISRFACEKSYFRPSDLSAKEKAFAVDKDGEVSVFRIDDLTEAQLWALGDDAVRARSKPAIASLEFAAARVRELGLSLVIAEPPVRHAAIQDWPIEDQRLELQQRLADACTVRLRGT